MKLSLNLVALAVVSRSTGDSPAMTRTRSWISSLSWIGRVTFSPTGMRIPVWRRLPNEGIETSTT